MEDLKPWQITGEMMMLRDGKLVVVVSYRLSWWIVYSVFNSPFTDFWLPYANCIMVTDNEIIFSLSDFNNKRIQSQIKKPKPKIATHVLDRKRFFKHCYSPVEVL